MFTGIVEEMGRVVSLVKADDVLMWDGTRGAGWILTVRCAVVCAGAYVGCSIAVNGTCLTVTAFTATEFTVGCAPETMRKTNLIDLAVGEVVNLERSAASDGRNSGHFVQGHVDGTGAVLAKWTEGDSLWVRLGVPTAILRYIVPKGYVAVDGTSLTVCAVGRAGSAEAEACGCGEGEGFFTLMLIAHTQSHVTLPTKGVGARVNLESDVLGKYVEAAAGGLAEAVTRLEGRLGEALARLEERLGGVESRLGALERAPV
jgi:riboflavin synthase